MRTRFSAARSPLIKLNTYSERELNPSVLVCPRGRLVDDSVRPRSPAVLWLPVAA